MGEINDSRYFEAPQYPEWPLRIYLGGGIPGCEEWQYPVAKALLENFDQIEVLNPRRKNFPIEDPTAAPQQIAWENFVMERSDILLLRFKRETIGPICLFELGYYMNHPGLIVWVEPEYQRRIDVFWQTFLKSPMVEPDIRRNVTSSPMVSDSSLGAASRIPYVNNLEEFLGVVKEMYDSRISLSE